MITDIVFVLVGLLLLYYGGEYLVNGATRLSLSMGISTAMVGLTVVGFGTSAPELIVSVLAAFGGKGDISLGNIVGSNIANIGLIIGLTAIIAPIPVKWGFIKRDMPVMLLASILYYAFALSGTITLIHGIIMFLILVGYLLYYTLEIMKKRGEKAHLNVTNVKRRPSSKKIDLIHISGGIVLLVLGGNFLVESATRVALNLGISEWLIAITVVAVGTSLPELTTSLIAGIRGYPEIAIGNIIGSVIFNILFIQSVVTFITPVAVEWSFVTFEFPVMVAAGVIMMIMLRTGYKVSRLEGSMLVVGYLAVMYFSFLRNPLG